MKSFKLFSILLVLALLMTACSQAATPAPAEPAATQAAVDQPADSAAPAATEAAPVEPGEATGSSQLQVAFSWPVYIDPAVGSDMASSSSLVNLYDTLVFPAADESMTPWLAETWDTSEDGVTWTFHLRQGVLFHDGSELTASDVVYSFNRLQTIGEGFGYMFTNVVSASVVDDYTVEFVLSEPSGLFLSSLVRLFVLMKI